MPITTITSLQNDRVKLVRALQNQGKTRRKEGKIALEGVRLFTDALDRGIKPEFILFTPDADAGLLDRLDTIDAACYEVTAEIMTACADTQSPQGVIAVVPMPDLPVPTNPTFVLILDGVADPGNMGGILRTAAAAGVDVVVLAPGCVDPFNPKALRGGMGAHFRVPVLHKKWDQIREDLHFLSLYLADSDGSKVYSEVDWLQPAGLIIGGEAHGADQQAHSIAKEIISIPMANEAESLNAAAASAVILFEAHRQRLSAAGRDMSR